MNHTTKEKLKDFTRSVIDLAIATSSFTGLTLTQETVKKATALMDALDKDETIV